MTGYSLEEELVEFFEEGEPDHEVVLSELTRGDLVLLYNTHALGVEWAVEMEFPERAIESRREMLAVVEEQIPDPVDERMRELDLLIQTDAVGKGEQAFEEPPDTGE